MYTKKANRYKLGDDYWIYFYPISINQNTIIVDTKLNSNKISQVKIPPSSHENQTFNITFLTKAAPKLNRKCYYIYT